MENGSAFMMVLLSALTSIVLANTTGTHFERGRRTVDSALSLPRPLTPVLGRGVERELVRGCRACIVST